MTNPVTKEAAISFIQLLNGYQPFVPPIQFNNLNNHPVIAYLLAQANQQPAESVPVENKEKEKRA